MPSTGTPSEPNGDQAFVRRLFIVVAIGTLIAAIWALSDLLLLLFGSILFVHRRRQLTPVTSALSMAWCADRRP